MPIGDYVPKLDLWTGVTIGVGLLVAPVAIPVIAQVARPLLKTVIKGGYMACERASGLLADALETIEDLTAEAKAEVHAELIAAKEEEA